MLLAPDAVAPRVPQRDNSAAASAVLRAPDPQRQLRAPSDIDRTAPHRPRSQNGRREAYGTLSGQGSLMRAGFPPVGPRGQSMDVRQRPARSGSDGARLCWDRAAPLPEI